jgi:hypothetical protein
MHTKPLPEIAPSDLQAVRDFLTSTRDEQAATRTPKVTPPRSLVTVRLGIPRARMRSAAKPVE